MVSSLSSTTSICRHEAVISVSHNVLCCCNSLEDSNADICEGT
uniref:Uncharacterized protein n=1 Tax=Ciona intestinalis TaxID=7719 RepID=H2XJQ3_CIOIN